MAEEQTPEKEPKWRYRLQLVSERHQRVVFTFSMPVWITFVFGILLMFATALLALFIVTNTPLRQYLPGYLDMNKRTVVVESALRIDSIARESDLRDLYLNNLIDILQDRGTSVNEIQRYDSMIANIDDTLREASIKELEFRNKYEQQERFGLNAISENTLSAVSFINIVKGWATMPEDESQVSDVESLRLSVDGVVPVLAPIEATVISIRYIIGEGYELVLQCSNEYVIVVSHVSSVVTQVGRTLKAGAVIGHAGQEPQGEDRWISVCIWHKGKPIDPSTVMDY